MTIDTTPSREHDPQPAIQEHHLDASGEPRAIPIKPEDTIESILMAVRQQSAPVVLLLPEEESQVFSDPSHFEQLRAIRDPREVCFLIPRSRFGTIARYVHEYGFTFASSLQKAQTLLLTLSQKAGARDEARRNDDAVSQAEGSSQEILPQDVPTQRGEKQQTHRTNQSPQAAPPLEESPGTMPTHTPRKRPQSRQIALMTTLVALLVVVGAVLFPALFTTQTNLKRISQAAAPAVTSVGQVAFSSSGQLDPGSSTGLNDTIIVSLHHLATPAVGQSDYAWLMPDPTDDNTIPLLLGKLSMSNGSAQFTYTNPDHKNLLSLYSGFEVVEQPNDQISTTPSLDPKTWRDVGSIPNTPTPGDEKHYSLLSHLRHLLAKDPTLQQIGLQGGIDIWVYRNTEKVLEWSSAARDSWAGHQTELIHRHMLRVLQYLDGTDAISTTGDIPVGSPMLVDPQAGRIGLLNVSQTQMQPSFLMHVDVHLRGLIEAPGHSEAQKALAIKIDTALKMDITLLQNVRQEAIKLVKMSDTQLLSPAALSLLNDMVTNANSAYTGQFDATIGENINGIAWIHNELQGIAAIPVTTASTK